MPLMDCDAPAAPVPTYTPTDLFDRLSLLRLNLWRYNIVALSGGALAVNPMTDIGSQQRGWAVPGGTPSARITITTTPGLAHRDGAAYAMSFLGVVDVGTATLRAGWRDALGNPITGIADQAWTITTTPTTFTWEDYFSDDTDFGLAGCVFFLGVTGTGDIAAGKTVRVTELQNQTDNYFDQQGVTLPWRPARGEPDLAIYGEYILGLNKAEMALKPNQRIVVGPEGGGLQVSPVGPVRFRIVTGTTDTLLASDAGGIVLYTSASPVNVTVPPDMGLETKSCIALWQFGAGLVTVVEGAGVDILPKLGGSLALGGQGDLVQLVLVPLGDNKWGMI